MITKKRKTFRSSPQAANGLSEAESITGKSRSELAAMSLLKAFEEAAPKPTLENINRTTGKYEQNVEQAIATTSEGAKTLPQGYRMPQELEWSMRQIAKRSLNETDVYEYAVEKFLPAVVREIMTKRLAIEHDSTRTVIEENVKTWLRAKRQKN